MGSGSDGRAGESASVCTPTDFCTVNWGRVTRFRSGFGARPRKRSEMDCEGDGATGAHEIVVETGDSRSTAGGGPGPRAITAARGREGTERQQGVVERGVRGRESGCRENWGSISRCFSLLLLVALE